MQDRAASPLRTIYLDECGYTGVDLLDASQPVFVIASHDFTEAEALSLASSHFADVQAAELKHRGLGRRLSGQRAVAAFLTEIARQRPRVKFSLVHKRFSVVVKLVDFVVETAFMDSGVDLSVSGEEVALAHALYFALASCGEPYSNNVLRAAQTFFRSPTPRNRLALRQALALRSGRREIDGLLDSVRWSLDVLPRNAFDDLPRDVLDMQATTTLMTVFAWRRTHGPGFRLVHDSSGNLAKIWDVVSETLSGDCPAATVARGSFVVEYPIGLERTDFVRSEDSIQVQLADVLAGAMARWTRWFAGDQSPSDSYGRLLHESFFARFFNGQDDFDYILWPTPETLPEPHRANHVGLIEYMERLLAAKGAFP